MKSDEGPPPYTGQPLPQGPVEYTQMQPIQGGPPPPMGYAQPQMPVYTTQQGPVIVTQPHAPGTVVYVEQGQPSRPSMTGHYVFSCIVCWCCNCLFGSIAFCIAVAGSSAANPEEARHLGKASLSVNIAGIIITIVLTAVTFILIYTNVITMPDWLYHIL